MKMLPDKLMAGSKACYDRLADATYAVETKQPHLAAFPHQITRKLIKQHFACFEHGRKRYGIVQRAKGREHVSVEAELFQIIEYEKTWNEKTTPGVTLVCAG